METLLDKLHELQYEKHVVDVRVLEEKAKNRGIPHAHSQRLTEQEYIRQSLKMATAIVETKNLIIQKGDPLMTLTDVLASLYAIEASFDLESPERAWDALTGVLDRLEKEFERVGK